MRPGSEDPAGAARQGSSTRGHRATSGCPSCAAGPADDEAARADPRPPAPGPHTPDRRPVPEPFQPVDIVELYCCRRGALDGDQPDHDRRDRPDSLGSIPAYGSTSRGASPTMSAVCRHSSTWGRSSLCSCRSGSTGLASCPLLPGRPCSSCTSPTLGAPDPQSQGPLALAQSGFSKATAMRVSLRWSTLPCGSRPAYRSEWRYAGVVYTD